MKITVAERHRQASDALHRYAVDKVEHLSRYFDGIISVDVVLDSEKNREICELVAHLVRKKVVKATAEAQDLHAAVDAAVDKLKKQLRRYKGRVKEKAKEKGRRSPSGGAAPTSAGPGPENLTRSRVFLRKPMTPEEAILQLESYEKRNFLIFRDAERGRIRVLHRLPDGGYELIEPVD